MLLREHHRGRAGADEARQFALLALSEGQRAKAPDADAGEAVTAASRPRLLDLFCGAGGAAIEERFWSHVDKRRDDKCWYWTGATRGYGYGQMSMRPLSPQKAHRVSFVIAFGWEPPAVMHKCDNPVCVNPRHLFGGTQKDNMADAAAKGRYARQIQEPVKVTVRALAEAGMAQRAIARQVGIDRRSVGRILASA